MRPAAIHLVRGLVGEPLADIVAESSMTWSHGRKTRRIQLDSHNLKTSLDINPHRSFSAAQSHSANARRGCRIDPEGSTG